MSGTGSAACVAVALLLVACGSGDGTATSVATDRSVLETSPETPVPTDSSSTESSTTESSTSPSAISSTTTTAPFAVGFDPECTEVDPSRPPVTSDETALDVFGPLPDSPSIEIALPQGHSKLTGELMTTSATSTRVPGGVLLSIQSNSSGYFPGGMLVVVDHDGAMRWVRCFDQHARVYAAPATASPAEALLATDVPTQSAMWASDWNVISLTDGTVVRTLDDLIHASGLDVKAADQWMIASGFGTAVLGADPDHVIDVATDRLLRLDLLTMRATDLLPYPPEFDGHPVRELQLEINPAGQLLRMGLAASDLRHRVPNSVEVDGAWVTDPSALLEAWPITAGYTYIPNPDGSPISLEAYDATGHVLWQRDDVVMRMAEGFSAAVDGDVVMASSCEPAADQPACDSGLGGYSMADGSTRWSLDQFRVVSAFGDGLAIISQRADQAPDAGWMLIDTSTGEMVADDQHWDDPATFDSQCCGGDEFFRVERQGGVLVVLSGPVVRIWHPRALAHSTVHVSLP